MTRTLLPCVLAALLSCSGSAAAAPVGSKSSTPQAKPHDRDRHCENDDRRRDRFDRSRGRDTNRSSRPGYQRRGAPPRLPMYGEVTRDCRPVRHSASCSCSPCRRRGQRHGDDHRVLLSPARGVAGEPVTVLSPGRDHRVRRERRRESERLPWLFRGNDRYRQSHTGDIVVGDTHLRVHADRDCREPGTVLASSGNLYVQVRADGGLTIRSR